MPMQPFNEQKPAGLSSEILEVLAKVSPEKDLRGDALAQAVVNLSRLFTTARATLPPHYLDDSAHASAYLSYFLPVNLSKVQVLLDELPNDNHEISDRPMAVLDLGCGPGTGALALLDWLWHRNPERAKSLSVLAADTSHESLQDAKRLWEAYCNETGIPGQGLRCVEGNLEHPLKGDLGKQLVRGAPYDLMIIANTLNELFPAATDPSAERAAVVAQLLPFLSTHGTIMIVEPALRQTARELHQLRNHLLKQNLCTVYSPCLHERACPALDHPDDWCHEERPWQTPPVIAVIDRDVGFIKDALKFSYLLLRTDGRTIVPRNTQTFRVVSELRKLKGEKRAWLCNETGRPEVGRLDRKASPENAAVDSWHRGAIVQIERIVRKEREGKVSPVGRIESDAAVEIVRSV
ncbi:MAG TPA: small ribosomal subunit Rsm22 family protein [Nitrospiraceae bacterium]|nr:small ribosomal subunit Rsm22 family protein [Nitrospiraceae bacterium]